MLDKQVVHEKLSDVNTLDFKFNYLEYRSKESLLNAEDLSFGYNKDNLLLKNLSIKVNKDLCYRKEW